MWDDLLALTPYFIASNDVLCAVSEGTVVGCAAVCVRDSVFELEHLWVDPEWQGRGVVRLLLAASVENARSRGAARLRVVSDPNAKSFYARMGADCRLTSASTQTVVLCARLGSEVLVGPPRLTGNAFDGTRACRIACAGPRPNSLWR
ncbi:GNAT family N-acetyltransferase [Parvivirga hydrogeniphila]|uniref:GNAT family N-acetyltransferase n=1 Tax=Parvivirga hydrogeniphila TaxID=2939460 RepID=UPI00389AC796